MARLIVISGPSGAGKGTLIAEVVPRFENLHVSVSVTTRDRRAGEHQGVDYHFVSRNEFIRRVEAGEFLEWAEYGGQLYGTPRDAVEGNLHVGSDVILEIELQGARQVMERVPAAVGIFIAPPGIDELEDRLRRRDTDSDESIARRLEHARDELDALERDLAGGGESREFPYVIVNADVETAADELQAAIADIRSNDPAR